MPTIVVDFPAPDPFWKIVHRIADEQADRMRSVIARARRLTIEAISKRDLIGAIGSGNIERAVSLVPIAEIWEDGLRSDLAIPLRTAFVNTGEASLAELSIDLRIGDRIGDRIDKAAKRQLRLDALAASAWADNHAAELIREIGPRTREAVRQIISNGILTERSPARVQEDIAKLVGLTKRQTLSLEKMFQRRLENGVPRARAREIRDARARKMLKKRSIDISSTESIRAASAGQQSMWLESKRKGLLPKTAMKSWIVTPDDRLDTLVCEPMDGQIVKIEGLFVTGVGAAIEFPPAHVRCRCAQGIVSGRRKIRG